MGAWESLEVEMTLTKNYEASAQFLVQDVYLLRLRQQWGFSAPNRKHQGPCVLQRQLEPGR
jgi:hypothetical protein